MNLWTKGGCSPLVHLLLAVIFISGCASDPQDIKSRESSVFFPSLEVCLGCAESKYPSLEFTYSRIKSDDHQVLNSGEYFEIESQIINGPTTMDQKSELKRSTLAVKDVMGNDKFGFGWLIGFGHTSFDLTLDSSADHVSYSTSSAGLAGGIEAHLKMGEKARGRLRYDVVLGPDEGAEEFSFIL